MGGTHVESEESLPARAVRINLIHASYSLMGRGCEMHECFSAKLFNEFDDSFGRAILILKRESSLEDMLGPNPEHDRLASKRIHARRRFVKHPDRKKRHTATPDVRKNCRPA